MSVIFKADMSFYDINGLFAIFKWPVDLLSTCPGFFIDGHNAQFNYIKENGMTEDILFVVLFSQKIFVSGHQIQKNLHL